jgi:hypothetical protein
LVCSVEEALSLCGSKPTSRILGVAASAEAEICWQLGVVFTHDDTRQAANVRARMFLELLRPSVSVLEEAEVV